MATGQRQRQKQHVGLRNVLILGAAFALIFTAFQTSSFFQASLLKSLGYGDDGFYGLALLYASMAATIFLAPAVVDVLTPRIALFIGAIAYCLFMASLVHVVVPLFLLASALNGIGAAVLWTSQGTLLTRFSDDATRGRNAGVFWSCLQSSLLIGSVLSYLVVPDGKEISQHTATKLYVALLTLCCLGTACVLALPTTQPGVVIQPNGGKRGSSRTSSVNDDDDEAEQGLLQAADGSTLDGPGPSERRTGCSTVWQSLKVTFSLLFQSTNLQLMMVTTFYSGIMLTFWQGKYGEIVSGKDTSLDPLPSAFRPRLISWLILTIGVAEALGGVLFGRLADKFGRGPVMVLGSGLPSMAGYVLCYFMFVHQTINPTVTMAFVIGFLLGVGDAALNTVVYAELGKLFEGMADANAFCLYFCFRSTGAGVAFAYSGRFSLTTQLIILGVLLIVGVASFVAVLRRGRGQ